MNGNENKCKDCRWLTGEKKTIGVGCENPENKEKWEKRKWLWKGEYRMPCAMYKQPSALACKKFEPKE